MRGNRSRLTAAIVTLVFLSVPGFTQTDQLTHLDGEVRSPSEPLLHGYAAVLEEFAGHRDFERVDVQPDGAFRFHNVPYGDYFLKIETNYGEVIRQDFLDVNSRTTVLAVELPVSTQMRPPSGEVAAARLLHPPARKAFQAFAAAQKLSESGRYADAAKALQRAIEISPDFADAHSNLAVQYMRLGRFDDAVSEISRAIAVGQPTAPDLSNLAYAQIALGHPLEATQSARAAVRIDPANMNAQYMLGALLARDRRTLREGISHLELAAETLPSARATLKLAQAALAETSPTH